MEREFVSRRLSFGSTTPTFYSRFWHTHCEYWSSHRERFALASHSFAIQIHSSYYFDSYGLPPFIPSIQSFINRKCIVRDYNTIQLQGPTSNVCGKYCFIFALYMDRGYTPRQFVGLFTKASADNVVSDMFQSEFGILRNMSPGGQSCGSRSTRYVCYSYFLHY